MLHLSGSTYIMIYRVGHELCLKVQVCNDIRVEVKILDDGKPYTLDIKPHLHSSYIW